MPDLQGSTGHAAGCDLSVLVPVYNEEASILPFLERVEAVLKTLGGSSEIVFCLDPSPDRTEAVILEEISRNPDIRLVVFSRRFGQPSATMAGLLLCQGAVAVVIDVDLQDPPELIPQMYARLREGYEVVYAKRRSRKGETAIKRIVSRFGYWVIASGRPTLTPALSLQREREPLRSPRPRGEAQSEGAARTRKTRS